MEEIAAGARAVQPLSVCSKLCAIKLTVESTRNGACVPCVGRKVMPNVANLYFKTAILFLILGILMGLQMAMSGEHNVIGPHAHANLLGWVTMALFGGYLALNPAKAESRFALLQFWIYAGGVVVMVPSLYLLYLGYAFMEPLVAASSLVVLAGALMFAAIIFGKVPVAGRLSGKAPV